jgi:HEPN pEK499 p136
MTMMPSLPGYGAKIATSIEFKAIKVSNETNANASLTYDLRLDIPGKAYIASQLISLLERGGTLFEAKKCLFSDAPYSTTFKDKDIYQYRIHDHSLIISVMYCVIVVPREVLDLPRDHQIYSDFDEQGVIKLFSISEPVNCDSYQLIRFLRNSVAHALFSIREESRDSVSYEFWSDRAPNFRAKIGQSDLMRFLSTVGVRLANAVLAKK